MSKRSLRMRREADAVKGLFLQTRGHNQSWIFRYSFGGRERGMGLGSASDITRADARALAVAANELLKQGVDPIIDKKEKRRRSLLAADPGATFRALADAWIEANRDAWTEEHVKHTTSLLSRYVYPVFGNDPVDRIDGERVLEVLKPIWTKMPMTADRVRGRIENILDYAKVLKKRIGDNPAQWRGHLKHALPSPRRLHKVKHQASIPFAELPAFLAKLRARKNVRAAALEFLTLTGARPGEVIKMTGAELDFEDCVWIAPAAHMKARKEQRRPLTDRALEIVKKLNPKKNALVFRRDDGRMLDEDFLLDELRCVRPGSDTAHGMRSSFRMWAEATRLDWRLLAEMQIAHETRGAVERAYARDDLIEQRREMMTAWERYLLEPALGEKVIAFSRVS